jgi:tetratricopeptide (TPR) repeat protein
LGVYRRSTRPLESFWRSVEFETASVGANGQTAEPIEGALVGEFNTLYGSEIAELMIGNATPDDLYRGRQRSISSRREKTSVTVIRYPGEAAAMNSERTSACGSSRSRSAGLLLASLAALAGACTTTAPAPGTAEAVDRAVSNSELAATHNDRGNALFNQGEFAGAMVEYREAIRLDPNSAVAHSNLGRAMVNQGELEQALAEFREASRLEPTNAGLWL